MTEPTSPPTEGVVEPALRRPLRSPASAGWPIRRPIATGRPSPRRRPRPVSPGRGIAYAAIVGVVGALAIVVLGGVLTLTGGLFAVAAVIGYATAWALRIGGGSTIGDRRRAYLALGARAGIGRPRTARPVALRPHARVACCRSSTTSARCSGRSCRSRPSSQASSRGSPPDDGRGPGRPALPPADRGRLRRRHRGRRRVVGRPPDAGAPAAPVVPALRRDVVDRRVRGWPDRGLPRRVRQPGPPDRGLHPHGRHEPEPSEARPRAGAVRAVLRRRPSPRRADGSRPSPGPATRSRSSSTRRWASGRTTDPARNACTGRSPTPTTTATARTGSTSSGTCSGGSDRDGRGRQLLVEEPGEPAPVGPRPARRRPSAAAAPRPRRRRTRTSARAGAR